MSLLSFVRGGNMVKIIIFIKDKVIGLRKGGKWYCMPQSNLSLDSEEDIYRFISSWVRDEPFTLELVG